SQDEKDYVARIQLADNEYPKAAADLTELLLRPVADRLGKLRLVIVADGALQYLPFEALPSPQTARSASPTPLIVDHEIVNLPSASTLAVIRNEATHRRPSDRTIAVAADPVFELTDDRMLKLQNIAQPTTSKSEPTSALMASFNGGTLRIEHFLPRL